MRYFTICKIAEVRSDHQGRDAVVVSGVDIFAKVNQEFYQFQALRGGSLTVIAVDEAGAAGSHQRGLAVLRTDLRIGTVRKQELRQFDVPASAARISAVA